MNERPILFSGPMVTAILSGAKTQTRRVIKPQPTANLDWVTEWGWTFFTPDKHISGRVKNPAMEPREIFLRCPYALGQRLWVRETWAPISPDEERRPIKECNIEYKADTPHAKYPGDWPEEEAKGNEEAPKWCPSIHMPRWASRITLEITGVRVERLFDISQEDAEAEGVSIEATRTLTHRGAFAITWDTINKKRGYGWEGGTNPWVWVIEFRRVTP
jgi:hypothetical protein